MSTLALTAFDIESIVQDIGSTRHHLVPLLHAIQEKYHYLPEPALKQLSQLTDNTLSDILGVATFYHQFRLKPAGKHMIKVCVGTACHVKGANQVVKDFKEILNIPANGDTDESQLFTISEVACLGCCMLAPAVQIDQITYGPVKRQMIRSIISDFLKSQQPSASEKQRPQPNQEQQGVVKLCLCSSCQAAGSKQIHDKLTETIQDKNLSLQIKTVGCTGASFKAPLIEIEAHDKNYFQYGLVKPDDIPLILDNHFKPSTWLGQFKSQVNRLLNFVIADDHDLSVIRFINQVRPSPSADHDPFMASQKPLATEGHGQLDPLSITDYLAHQGFNAFKLCHPSAQPEAIIELINQSGLRGRGGAGFPTAQKWLAVAKAKEQPKYLICNGDEGDPGAFMDRMLMESFPFRILEGMAIAALACGINQGYIFLRSEYPLAIDRMKQAIEHCEHHQLLGKLKIELIISAGAFICGEETAMIAAIEGRRGQPHLRPPFPADSGLWEQPTLINNVETYALIPWIILNQAKTFKLLGTASSAGTKTFALAGKVNQGGLIEVEMGTTLKSIIYDIGQGIINNKALKAVQIGGPAGGCLPASYIDTPLDYESLKTSGTIMGSGGLIVLDEDDCMVDMAKYFMNFTQNESCGKCTFCRIGTKRLLEILEQLTSGLGQPHHLDQLKQLAEQVKQGSLCGLGKAAPNPILTGLRYFEDEFVAHTQNQCPAKKCQELIYYRVTMKCIGCTKCAQNCPADAIEARPYEQQEIDQEKCTKCDICFQVCPEKAIKKEDSLNVETQVRASLPDSNNNAKVTQV